VLYQSFRIIIMSIAGRILDFNKLHLLSSIVDEQKFSDFVQNI
jgi:hypothetical protein